MVHKFDKMNTVNCGIFHPRGNEVIINSEVVRLFFIFVLELIDYVQQRYNGFF